MAGKVPLVLLLHQSPQSSREMEPIIAAWGSRFTLLAPDAPGYGFSQPLLHAGQPMASASIDDFATATLEFADALGLGRFGIYGFHTGASIGVAMAHALPERIAAIAANGLGDPHGRRTGRNTPGIPAALRPSLGREPPGLVVGPDAGANHFLSVARPPGRHAHGFRHAASGPPASGAAGVPGCRRSLSRGLRCGLQWSRGTPPARHGCAAAGHCVGTGSARRASRPDQGTLRHRAHGTRQ